MWFDMAQGAMRTLLRVISQYEQAVLRMTNVETSLASLLAESAQQSIRKQKLLAMQPPMRHSATSQHLFLLPR